MGRSKIAALACLLLLFVSPFSGLRLEMKKATDGKSRTQRRSVVSPPSALTSSSSSSSRGFGSSSSKSQVVASAISSSDTKNENKHAMEASIQSSISSSANKGLRECMNLFDEINTYNISFRSMSLLQQSAIPERVRNNMANKMQQLEDMDTGGVGGWNEHKVRAKLHEITWDASAAFRDERQKTQQVSEAVQTHMAVVASWCLQAKQQPSSSPSAATTANANILDVGCGNGIILKYLSSSPSSSSNFSYLGIDLSNGMLDVAKTNHPNHAFLQQDFASYTLPEHAAPFTVALFNECLHNFKDVSQVLRKALSLLDDGGLIVISHPRGFANVFSQSTANKWLSPSLLPTAEELKLLAADAHYGFHVLVEPDVKAPHYLAVLKKK